MTLSSQLPVWDAPLLHCLSAGWALPEDMRCILPVLAAIESTRQACYADLAARVTPAIGQLLARAHGSGGFGDMLRIWQNEEDCTVPASLPTFALYFTQQYIAACREQNDGAVLAFLLVQESAAAQFRAALKRAHQKRMQQICTDDDAEPASVQTLRDGLLFAEAAPTIAMEIANKNALDLLERLFEDLYQAMRHQRIASLCTKIQAKKSLQNTGEPVIAMSVDSGEALREEYDEKRNQQFSVARLPCQSEAMDPRVVRIAPGKFNNLHKHAHETLFCLIKGSGEVLIGDTWTPVKTGESIFAPRWTMHQTHNTGDCELVMLAITDFYLSNKVFIGKTSTTVM